MSDSYLYKIVRCTSNPDVYDPYLAQGTGVHYRIGQWTRRASPLFIYETYMLAYMGASHFGTPIAILEGISEDKKMQNIPAWGLDVFGKNYSQKEIIAFWEETTQHDKKFLRTKFDLLQLTEIGSTVHSFKPLRVIGEKDFEKELSYHLT